MGVTLDQHATDEVGHGRHEERSVTVIPDPKGLPAGWPDAHAVVQVNRERTVNGVTVSTKHYFISSHRWTAKELGGVIRGYWRIEVCQADDPSSRRWVGTRGIGYH